MKQRLTNITDTSAKRRGFVAMFAIVLIIALAGSTVYAADSSPKKAGYPEFEYTVNHMTRYNSDLPDSDMLSMEKAAEAIAKYIYDFYGENGDGYAMWMSYTNSSNQWGCRVTKADTELARGNIIFSVIIDAEHGKRIRMYDMRETDTDLPEKRITSEQITKMKSKKPSDMEKYEQLAMEAAKKHFYDDKVADLNYNGMHPKIIGRNEEDVAWYKETILTFVATDTTGRESEIIIIMETEKLREIRNKVYRGIRSGNR